jgi:hypothetical protein
VIEIPELTYRSSLDSPSEEEIRHVGPRTLTVTLP